MGYHFNPMSEDELNAANLVADGVYDFEVVKAERQTSSKGNPMCKLQLRIWDSQGKVHFVYDYLVFSSVPLNIRKVKHFCDSVGLQEEYKKGNIPEDLELKSGKVQIATEDPMPNNKGGMYPAKNVVIDYVMTDKGATKFDSAIPDFDDKDLPF